jgi:predicted phosphate transport protein (TIGR00153 family)
MFFTRFMANLTGRKRLPGLLEHYEPVAKGVMVVEAALKEYANNGLGAAFQALAVEIDTLEGQADKIKRRIRRLPRDFFMEVDKTLFLNFTRSQDNILDSAQDALNWLGMRQIVLPTELLTSARAMTREACRSVELLKPAIQGTMDLVYGQTKDRTAVKDNFHTVRVQHSRVSRSSRKLLRESFAVESDFKNIYQFVKFIEHVHEMSHNAEGAVDVLRAMIAR